MPGRERAVALTLAALGLALAVISPAFFTVSNARDLFLANLPVLIVALGALLVILTGEIDISCGSMFAVCSVVAGVAATSTGSLVVALVAASAAGLALGALNGVLVAYGRIPSIVATLAAMVALRDGLRWVTGGAWITDVPRAFQWFGVTQDGYPAIAGGRRAAAVHRDCLGAPSVHSGSVALCGRVECGSGAACGYSRRAREVRSLRGGGDPHGDRGGLERRPIQPGAK